MKKIAALWICSFILFSCIIIIVEIAPTTDAKIIYVDDDGTADCWTITEALFLADDGDTIYVNNGTYFENIVIEKIVTLVGENKETTIINGTGTSDVFRIWADFVNISGFTITNSGSNWIDAGIDLYNYDNAIIKDNIIKNNRIGIYLYSTWESKIWNNTFINNGIYTGTSSEQDLESCNISLNNTVNGKTLYYYKNANNLDINGTSVGQLIFVDCDNIEIRNLQINNTDIGIGILHSSNFYVNNNTILFNNGYGIYVYQSSSNIIITGNNISCNWYGVYFQSSSGNQITGNTIVLNSGRGIHFQSASNNDIIGNDFYYNEDGIYLSSSSNCNIVNNNISNNRSGLEIRNSQNVYIISNNFVNDGVYLSGNQPHYFNSHEITTDNLVNGKPIYYYKDANNTDIDGIDVGQLILAGCHDFNISNLNIDNTYVGIEIAYSWNISLEKNNVSNDVYGLYIYYLSRSNLTNNTISYNDNRGVYLYYSDNNTIEGNNISYNYLEGIYISYSSDDNILANNITFNQEEGIYISTLSYSNIIGNIILLNDDQGIYTYRPSNCSIINNTFSSNDGAGLYLYYSQYNIIENNKAISNYRGIDFSSDCHNNTIKENNISWNSNYGLEMTGSWDNLITSNNISSNGGDGIYIGYSTYNNSILGNNISKNYDGIELYSSINNTVTDNDISENENGVRVYYKSKNNKIKNNKIIENTNDGVYFSASYNNELIDNIISYNHYNGIDSWSSSNNITRNNISFNNNNGIYLSSSFNTNITYNNITMNFGHGISSSSSSGNKFDSNIISFNDDYGIYFYSTDNTTITGNNISSNNADGIQFEYSRDNNIEANNITLNGGEGIYLRSSSNNFITNSTISSNDDDGMYIYYTSNNNIITMNTILSNNDCGIYITQSSNNWIFHNNIILNVNQAQDYEDDNNWDNGYPSGGNFWSDYNGFDLNSTSSQDVPPPDGIGDTPYIIDLDSQDNYPLITPVGGYVMEDDMQPTIYLLYPPNYSHTNNTKPTIGAFYYDASGINTSTVVMVLDSTDVTALSIVNESGIAYTPSLLLSDGNHNVYLEVRDDSPEANLATTSWEFTIDSTPPSAILDLTISSRTKSTIELTWTAPGDDLGNGNATSYDICYSSDPITESNWDSVIKILSVPLPQSQGQTEVFTVTDLEPETTYYFALKTSDEVPNTSPISNCAEGSTLQIKYPLISMVTVSNVTQDSAIIVWITDEPCDSRVNYSVNSDLSFYSTVHDPTLVELHVLTLTSLNPEEDYYFEVSSMSASGNAITDNNGSRYYGFKTLSSVILQISNVSVEEVNADLVVITWVTNRPSTSLVSFSIYPSLSDKSSAYDSEFSVKHSIKISSLSSDQIYYFEVTSIDSSWNSVTDNNNSSYYTFTTLPIDITLPEINSVSIEDLTKDRAVITWSTNVPTDSTVRWSTHSDLTESSIIYDPTLTNRHSVILKSLIPDQTYYFEVTSKDRYQNSVTDDNALQYYSFTTLPHEELQEDKGEKSFLESLWWLFLLIALIAVILLILVVILNKRKPAAPREVSVEEPRISFKPVEQPQPAEIPPPPREIPEQPPATKEIPEQPPPPPKPLLETDEDFPPPPPDD